MGSYKRGLYWRQEQDDDMRIMLTTDNTSKEWLQSYRRTLPRLRKMGESILRRYYTCQDNKVVDIISDAITNLLLNGKFNSDKPKMYAYCGTILKRYFYDILIFPKLTKSSIDNNTDRNYDINDDEWVLNNNVIIQPDDEFDHSERQIQYNYIIKIIDDGIIKCEIILSKAKNKNNKQGSIREIEFLKYAKKYFEENFIIGRVSILAIADYIMTRINIPQTVISRYLRIYFGISSVPDRIDNKKNIIDWVERRGMTDYIMDDRCPNDLYGRVNSQMKKK